MLNDKDDDGNDKDDGMMMLIFGIYIYMYIS